jgi:hypothetical protein
VLVFEQISAALERMGEHEMAARIEEKQFRASFIEELQFRQQSGSTIPAPGGEGGSNLPPEAGGAPINTATAEDMGTGGGGGASAGQPGLPNGQQTSVG